MADSDSCSESNVPSAQSKTSSAQLRKIKKPIIERRRRERINDSLNQVKTLVLDALNKDESRFSKMEKADILEMTVKHLKNVHKRQQQMSQAASMQQQMSQAASIGNRYSAGFTECAHEVKRYLSSVNSLSPDIHSRLMTHLSSVGQGALAAASSGAGQQLSIPPTVSNPTTTHVLLSSQPVTFIAQQENTAESQRLSPKDTNSNVIPLYINTGLLGARLQCYPGKFLSPNSDGESAESLSPLSTSSSHNSTHNGWSPEPPATKTQPTQHGTQSSVWRPW